jgi:hypothetical protein
MIRVPARAALAALFAALLALPVLALSIIAPDDYVRELYEDGIYFDFSSEEAAGRWFTPALVADLVRFHQLTDGYGFGFDLLVDGQDADIAGFDVTIMSLERGGAEVRATFENFGEPVTLDFTLTRHAHGWLIADITSRARDGDVVWQLSEMTREGLDYMDDAP